MSHRDRIEPDKNIVVLSLSGDRQAGDFRETLFSAKILLLPYLKTLKNYLYFALKVEKSWLYDSWIVYTNATGFLVILLLLRDCVERKRDSAWQRQKKLRV